MVIPLQVIISAVLPVFIILGIGFWIRRAGVLGDAADSGLTRLVIQMLYPCFVFTYLVGNPVLKDIRSLTVAPLVGFTTVAGGFVVAYWVGRLAKLKTGKGLRTFAMCNGVYNYGYIPIPLVLALFNSRETTAVLLLHNIGVEIAMWTVGILMLAGGSMRGFLKRVFNPPLIALLIALGLSLTGTDGYLPGWLLKTVEMLGNCAIPLGLMLAGAAIADLLRESSIFDEPRWPVIAVALRLGILPAAFVALAAFTPALGMDLRQVIVIQAAMPAGIFPIVLARHYKGDPRVAVKVVAATTFGAVVTMPLWIRFGLSWIGQ